VKKIKFFEEIFMSLAPISGVVCASLALKNLDLILGIVAIILFVVVFLKRKNYTDWGYEPSGE
jgi:nicotinamide riboside transporter PnuC